MIVSYTAKSAIKNLLTSHQSMTSNYGMINKKYYAFE